MKSDNPLLNEHNLKTIFQECRQCGTCCKKYKKVLLQGDEPAFIKKMGGHVGVDATLKELREKPLETLIEEKKEVGKVYMIHPDDKGCIFLECHDGLYRCKIYHYRPLSCQGFRCNLADDSFLALLLTTMLFIYWGRIILVYHSILNKHFKHFQKPLILTKE